MQIFWLILSLMTALAIVFIAIPLLRVSKKSALISSKQLHVTLYRERLQALAEQLQQAAITAEDYEKSKTELAAALLADVPEHATENLNRDPSFWLAGLLVIALPLMAITLYWHWGSSRQVAAWLISQRQAAVVQAEIHQLGSVAHIIDALQQRLQQNPNSAKGWYLLGKLYLSQQQYTKAAGALKQAYQIKPQDPQIALQYAQSLFFWHDRHLDAQATAVLQQLLKQTPNNVNAINLLALGAYRSGDYRGAIRYWQQLLPQFAQNSVDAKNLVAMITLAQQKIGVSAAVHSIQVHVSLDTALQQQATPSETLFIYAVAVNGPPMPLAIVRKQVKDLPLTVTLDASKAMLASMSLNNFTQVKVIARISKSGQAMPQAGDLEASSGVIDTQQHHGVVNIQIKN